MKVILIALFLLLCIPMNAQDAMQRLEISWYAEDCDTVDRWKVVVNGEDHYHGLKMGLVVIPGVSPSLYQHPHIDENGDTTMVVISKVGLTKDCIKTISINEIDGDRPETITPYFVEIYGGIQTGTATINYSIHSRDTVFVLPGDMDRNNVVDGVDMLLFAEEFGKTGVDWNNPADANKDGNVDGIDHLIISRIFGTVNSQNYQEYFRLPNQNRRE